MQSNITSITHIVYRMTTSQITTSSPAPASTAVVPKAEKSVFTEQEVTMFWENVSFSAPASGFSLPTNNKPKEPTPDVPMTTERLESVPDPAEKASTESLTEKVQTSPPETINGQSMHNVLWNLTGAVRPREFVGLLGPSGSGKTVLLNILSDRLAAPSGSVYKRNVYLNKRVPLTRELFGKLCTYVMQDDVLMETMTPYECLSFSANLRLSCSQEEKDKHVIETIALLKLQNCTNTLVRPRFQKSSLGGQCAAQGNLGRRAQTNLHRRRNRHQPLRHHPRWYNLYLTLLELTSGLDSFTAYTIVRLMRDMSHAGKAVMAIVQQPSTDIFNLFDKIYLLSSGREVYQVLLRARVANREKPPTYMRTSTGSESPSRPTPARETTLST